MKKLFALSTTMGIYLSTALPALAETIKPCDQITNNASFKNLCELNISQLIGRGLIIAFVVAALLALGYLMWGGFKWLTSGGDKAGVEGARNHIIASIIGLIIIFLSFFIINFIFQLLTGTTMLNLVLPTLSGI